jgi:hypothetical protein
MVPETKMKTEIEYRDETVPEIKTQTYTVRIPQVQTRSVLKPVSRTVTEEKMETYSVQVPFQEQVSVPRRVCRMVAKQVVVPVEPCCPDCARQYEAINDSSD